MDATAAAGLADAARAYGFGVVATDYDDDGCVDLFVANDSNPNFLYRNSAANGAAVRERRPHRAASPSTARRAPRPAWASTPATTTATAASISC